MSIKWLIIIFCVWFFSGCALSPTVFVYGKYLTSEQSEALTEQLKSEEFDVEVNSFDFPTSLSETTLLYSLLLKDPENISQVERIALDNGFSVGRTQGMTEGNHWYTKNAIALFLLPEDSARTKGVFKQDLMQEFRTEQCDSQILISLHSDGSYEIAGKDASVMELSSQKGSWQYRQYPYVELKKAGHQYSNYYFEISVNDTQDQISQIRFITLTPLNHSDLPDGCVLTYGQRY